VCTWTDHVPGQTTAGRISKPNTSGFGKVTKNSDVQSRLDRLELLLEKAVAGQASMPQISIPSRDYIERRDPEAHLTPSSNSQTSLGHQGIQADDGDGILLIDEGRSQFVSSLHFALLAEEVRISKERSPDGGSISGSSTGAVGTLVPQSYVAKAFMSSYSRLLMVDSMLPLLSEQVC
jgi:hypothetical protein